MAVTAHELIHALVAGLAAEAPSEQSRWRAAVLGMLSGSTPALQAAHEAGLAGSLLICQLHLHAAGQRDLLSNAARLLAQYSARPNLVPALLAGSAEHAHVHVAALLQQLHASPTLRRCIQFTGSRSRVEVLTPAARPRHGLTCMLWLRLDPPSIRPAQPSPGTTPPAAHVRSSPKQSSVLWRLSGGSQLVELSCASTSEQALPTLTLRVSTGDGQLYLLASEARVPLGAWVRITVAMKKRMIVRDSADMYIGARRVASGAIPFPNLSHEARADPRESFVGGWHGQFASALLLDGYQSGSQLLQLWSAVPTPSTPLACAAQHDSAYAPQTAVVSAASGAGWQGPQLLTPSAVVAGGVSIRRHAPSGIPYPLWACVLLAWHADSVAYCPDAALGVLPASSRALPARHELGTYAAAWDARLRAPASDAGHLRAPCSAALLLDSGPAQVHGRLTGLARAASSTGHTGSDGKKPHGAPGPRSPDQLQSSIAQLPMPVQQILRHVVGASSAVDAQSRHGSRILSREHAVLQLPAMGGPLALLPLVCLPIAGSQCRAPLPAAIPVPPSVGTPELLADALLGMALVCKQDMRCAHMLLRGHGLHAVGSAVRLLPAAWCTVPAIAALLSLATCFVGAWIPLLQDVDDMQQSALCMADAYRAAAASVLPRRGHASAPTLKLPPSSVRAQQMDWLLNFGVPCSPPPWGSGVACSALHLLVFQLDTWLAADLAVAQHYAAQLCAAVVAAPAFAAEILPMSSLISVFQRYAPSIAAFRRADSTAADGRDLAERLHLRGWLLCTMRVLIQHHAATLGACSADHEDPYSSSTILPKRLHGSANAGSGASTYQAGTSAGPQLSKAGSIGASLGVFQAESGAPWSLYSSTVGPVLQLLADSQHEWCGDIILMLASLLGDGTALGAAAPAIKPHDVHAIPERSCGPPEISCVLQQLLLPAVLEALPESALLHWHPFEVVPEPRGRDSLLVEYLQRVRAGALLSAIAGECLVSRSLALRSYVLTCSVCDQAGLPMDVNDGVAEWLLKHLLANPITPGVVRYCTALLLGMHPDTALPKPWLGALFDCATSSSPLCATSTQPLPVLPCAEIRNPSMLRCVFQLACSAPLQAQVSFLRDVWVIAFGTVHEEAGERNMGVGGPVPSANRQRSLSALAVQQWLIDMGLSAFQQSQLDVCEPSLALAARLDMNDAAAQQLAYARQQVKRVHDTDLPLKVRMRRSLDVADAAAGRPSSLSATEPLHDSVRYALVAEMSNICARPRMPYGLQLAVAGHLCSTGRLGAALAVWHLAAALLASLSNRQGALEALPDVCASIVVHTRAHEVAPGAADAGAIATGDASAAPTVLTSVLSSVAGQRSALHTVHANAGAAALWRLVLWQAAGRALFAVEHTTPTFADLRRSSPHWQGYVQAIHWAIASMSGAVLASGAPPWSGLGTLAAMPSLTPGAAGATALALHRMLSPALQADRLLYSVCVNAAHVLPDAACVGVLDTGFDAAFATKERAYDTRLQKSHADSKHAAPSADVFAGITADAAGHARRLTEQVIPEADTAGSLVAFTDSQCSTEFTDDEDSDAPEEVARSSPRSSPARHLPASSESEAAQRIPRTQSSAGLVLRYGRAAASSTPARADSGPSGPSPAADSAVQNLLWLNPAAARHADQGTPVILPAGLPPMLAGVLLDALVYTAHSATASRDDIDHSLQHLRELIGSAIVAPIGTPQDPARLRASFDPSVSAPFATPDPGHTRVHQSMGFIFTGMSPEGNGLGTNGMSVNPLAGSSASARDDGSLASPVRLSDASSPPASSPPREPSSGGSAWRSPVALIRRVAGGGSSSSTEPTQPPYMQAVAVCLVHALCAGCSQVLAAIRHQEAARVAWATELAKLALAVVRSTRAPSQLENAVHQCVRALTDAHYDPLLVQAALGNVVACARVDAALQSFHVRAEWWAARLAAALSHRSSGAVSSYAQTSTQAMEALAHVAGMAQLGPFVLRLTPTARIDREAQYALSEARKDRHAQRVLARALLAVLSVPPWRSVADTHIACTRMPQGHAMQATADAGAGPTPSPEHGVAGVVLRPASERAEPMAPPGVQASPEVPALPEEVAANERMPADADTGAPDDHDKLDKQPDSPLARARANTSSSSSSADALAAQLENSGHVSAASDGDNVSSAGSLDEWDEEWFASDAPAHAHKGRATFATSAVWASHYGAVTGKLELTASHLLFFPEEMASEDASNVQGEIVKQRSVERTPDSAVSACPGCGRVITGTWLRSGKHHCRRCGGVFCDDCSQCRIPLPQVGEYYPVRVCDACYLAESAAKTSAAAAPSPDASTLQARAAASGTSTVQNVRNEFLRPRAWPLACLAGCLARRWLLQRNALELFWEAVSDPVGIAGLAWMQGDMGPGAALAMSAPSASMPAWLGEALPRGQCQQPLAPHPGAVHGGARCTCTLFAFRTPGEYKVVAAHIQAATQRLWDACTALRFPLGHGLGQARLMLRGPSAHNVSRDDPWFAAPTGLLMLQRALGVPCDGDPVKAALASVDSAGVAPDVHALAAQAAAPESPAFTGLPAVPRPAASHALLEITPPVPAGSEVPPTNREWPLSTFLMGQPAPAVPALPAAVGWHRSRTGRGVHVPSALRATKSKYLMSLAAWTTAWVNRDISNFEYLMLLNSAAGRSMTDLAQYPVMPWVLADYESDTIDTVTGRLRPGQADLPGAVPGTIWRDLSKPIAALQPGAAQAARERAEAAELTDVVPADPRTMSDGYNWNLLRTLSLLTGKGPASAEDANNAAFSILSGGNYKFLYGSHYASIGAVLYWLLRVEPGTSASLSLQAGRFDHAERLFHSVPEAWSNVMRNPSDVKELIPQFFSDASFLRNERGLPLGCRRDGVQLGDVVLPPWAQDSPEKFVATMREALESDYVSEHLHEWIDLVFGASQRGPAADAADNLFFPATYEGAIDLSAVTDLRSRHAIEVQLTNFGQTPPMLFSKPHPPRLSRKAVLDTLLAGALALNRHARMLPALHMPTLHRQPILGVLFASTKARFYPMDVAGAWSEYAYDTLGPAARRDTDMRLIGKLHEELAEGDAPLLPAAARAVAAGRAAGFLAGTLWQAARVQREAHALVSPGKAPSSASAGRDGAVAGWVTSASSNGGGPSPDHAPMSTGLAEAASGMPRADASGAPDSSDCGSDSAKRAQAADLGLASPWLWEDGSWPAYASSSLVVLACNDQLLIRADGADLEAVGLGAAPSSPPIQRLRWHTQAITGLSMSEDGAFVVAGSADGTVSVWRTTQGTAGGVEHGAGVATAAAALYGTSGVAEWLLGSRARLHACTLRSRARALCSASVYSAANLAKLASGAATRAEAQALRSTPTGSKAVTPFGSPTRGSRRLGSGSRSSHPASRRLAVLQDSKHGSPLPPVALSPAVSELDSTLPLRTSALVGASVAGGLWHIANDVRPVHGASQSSSTAFQVSELQSTQAAAALHVAAGARVHVPIDKRELIACTLLAAAAGVAPWTACAAQLPALVSEDIAQAASSAIDAMLQPLLGTTSQAAVEQAARTIAATAMQHAVELPVHVLRAAAGVGAAAVSSMVHTSIPSPLSVLGAAHADAAVRPVPEFTGGQGSDMARRRAAREAFAQFQRAATGSIGRAKHTGARGASTVLAPASRHPVTGMSAGPALAGVPAQLFPATPDALAWAAQARDTQCWTMPDVAGTACMHEPAQDVVEPGLLASPSPQQEAAQHWLAAHGALTARQPALHSSAAAMSAEAAGSMQWVLDEAEPALAATHAAAAVQLPVPDAPWSILTGHCAPVTAVAASATHNMVASGSANGQVLLHRLSSGICVGALDPSILQSLPVTGLQWAPQAAILTVTAANTVSTWTARGRLLGVLRMPQPVVGALTLRRGSSTLVATAAGVAAFSPLHLTMQPEWTPATPAAAITSMSLARDGATVVLGHVNGTITMLTALAL